MIQVRQSHFFRCSHLCVLFGLTVFLLNCSKTLIKKEQLVKYNNYLKDQEYILKENVSIGNREVLKKGTVVKIWIEQNSSLIKIKCYPVLEQREHSIGKMIHYQINDDFEKKIFTAEDLDQLIHIKLALNPKKTIAKKKRK